MAGVKAIELYQLINQSILTYINMLMIMVFTTNFINLIHIRVNNKYYLSSLFLLLI